MATASSSALQHQGQLAMGAQHRKGHSEDSHQGLDDNSFQSLVAGGQSMQKMGWLLCNVAMSGTKGSCVDANHKYRNETYTKGIL